MKSVLRVDDDGDDNGYRLKLKIFSRNIFIFIFFFNPPKLNFFSPCFITSGFVPARERGTGEVKEDEEEEDARTGFVEGETEEYEKKKKTKKNLLWAVIGLHKNRLC